MRLKPIVRQLRRLVMLVSMGGIAFGVVPGCDDDVRAVLVTGMEQAAVTAVEAMFQTIKPDTGGTTDDTTDTTVPVVRIETQADRDFMLA